MKKGHVRNKRTKEDLGRGGSDSHGDSAFGGIPCASGGVRDEGKGIEVPGAGVWGSPPVAPSGAARSAGGENSLLHEKSPANAELFSWSIGDSNP